MNKHAVTIKPSGKHIAADNNAGLQDILFDYGVEFPCGGRGTCHKCKIQIRDGSTPITENDQRAFNREQLRDGWRLACRAVVTGDITIHIPQWETDILSDFSTLEFTPRDGYGIAIDLGSTTIVTQLIDLHTGEVLGVQSALNKQVQYGADVISRVDFAVMKDRSLLTRIIREQLYEMCQSLLSSTGITTNELINIIICGNTIMQHIFCDFELTSISQAPFIPRDESFSIHRMNPHELGWDALSGSAAISFIPGPGGLVGGDITAGVIATKLYLEEELTCLVDLGTNGEIVIGNKDRLLCTSTAAGPAFEGARISMGMRATSGAIYKVDNGSKNNRYSVIGGVAPRGICGSGLIDAVAAGYSTGIIKPNGRLLPNHSPWEIVYPIRITQKDIREIQLAKSAIAAGINILLDKIGANTDDVKTVHLAGGFGNAINPVSAYRIGLLPFQPDRISNAGNTALHGTKLLLFHPDNKLIEHVISYSELVALHEHPNFTDILAHYMKFPVDSEN